MIRYPNITYHELLEIAEVLLGYAESKEADGGKRPLEHMRLLRTALNKARYCLGDCDNALHGN